MIGFWIAAGIVCFIFFWLIYSSVANSSDITREEEKDAK